MVFFFGTEFDVFKLITGLASMGDYLFTTLGVIQGSRLFSFEIEIIDLADQGVRVMSH
jgi:hypothetical protein